MNQIETLHGTRTVFCRKIHLLRLRQKMANVILKIYVSTIYEADTNLLVLSIEIVDCERFHQKVSYFLMAPWNVYHLLTNYMYISNRCM